MPAAVPALTSVFTAVGGWATVAQIGATIALNYAVSSLSRPKRSSSSNRGLTLTVSESDYPRRIIYGLARVGGVRVYVESTGSSNDYLHFVLAISDGPNESIEAIYLDEQRIELVSDGTDANGVTQWIPDAADEDSELYEDLIRVKFHQGTEDQLADADLVSESSGNWTADHRLRGISYVYIRLKYSASVFPTGLPEVSFLVKGRNDIFDPRDDSTGYSTNAALCWRHYLTLESLGVGASYTEIDDDHFNAQANVCDEEVNLLAGGTEPRYSVNGVVSLLDSPRDILADFQSAMGGWRTGEGPWLRIFAGAHETPSFEITQDMLAGSVTLSNNLAKRDRTNSVKAVYYSSEHRYQFTDSPVREKTSYIEADNGRNASSLDLPLVSSGTQAQRIQSIELERSRFSKTLQLNCNLRALPAIAGRTVKFTFARYGWDEKVFLVTNSQPIFQSDGACLISLSLREVGSTVYDWSSSDELPVTTPADLVNEGQRVASISASPPSGVYLTTDFPMEVTLSSLTTDAEIRYSQSGIPNTVGSGTEYTAPVEIEANEIIFAKGFKTNYSDSIALAAAYTVEQVETPELSPVGGDYPSGEFPKSITVTTSTPGATIRYSTSAPIVTDADGTLYSSPVSVADGDTLYARAFKAGLLDSEQTNATYTGV